VVSAVRLLAYAGDSHRSIGSDHFVGVKNCNCAVLRQAVRLEQIIAANLQFFFGIALT
jgi:hypothetical protein